MSHSELSQNAVTVLERRYLKKDAEGKITETPDTMFRRVAHSISEAEIQYGNTSQKKMVEEEFYGVMTDLKFLPNSPTLMNAGRELGQLAACFVLPIEDSLSEIFDSVKNAAMIHKSGGGTGFDFSHLRPRDSRVGTTGGVASGPVSFMKVFNTATEQVKQGGTRRGANLATLRVDHPDIMEFINCKTGNIELTNFNISVSITDAFMESVQNNADYDLIDPRTKEPCGSLNSVEVYDALINHAWENGDPGIIFYDTVNSANPTPAIGPLESTNPCGEQPLLPKEACNLGSINLAKMIKNGEIDYDELKRVTQLAVHFLDNTIDQSKYPLPDIAEMVKSNRKIGLGIMGFADMLYQLNVPYNSEEALSVAAKVMNFVNKEAHLTSQKLAEERGAFPNYEHSVFKNQGELYRNATITTIAPTGTLSILADCSSGIEPLFALSFTRNVMDGDKLVSVNPYFKEVAILKGFYSDELMDTIAKKGSIQGISKIPENVQKVFVTSHDISPKWHVKMQAIFQKFTDNAISKTVNLPNSATRKDVKDVYDLAYSLQCKGVTVYRDGSRSMQVLTTQHEEPQPQPQTDIKIIRPDVLKGFTSKIKTGLGNLYVTVSEYNGKPFEIFATVGKSGKSITAKTEAIGRLISLALRSGVSVEQVIVQLQGICGEHPIFQNGGMVLSIPDAISTVLKKQYGKNKSIKNVEHSFTGETCPECGETISFEEGCSLCHFCGFSKCN